MANSPESPVGAAVFLLAPEWTVDNGCPNCRYVRLRVGALLRCAKHDVKVNVEDNCADYVPAPELAEARRLHGKP